MALPVKLYETGFPVALAMLFVGFHQNLVVNYRFDAIVPQNVECEEMVHSLNAVFQKQIPALFQWELPVPGCLLFAWEPEFDAKTPPDEQIYQQNEHRPNAQIIPVVAATDRA